MSINIRRKEVNTYSILVDLFADTPLLITHSLGTDVILEPHAFDTINNEAVIVDYDIVDLNSIRIESTQNITQVRIIIKK